MKFDHPHQLDDNEAKTRLQAFGEFLSNKYGLKVVWDGNVGRVSGKVMVVTVEGTLQLAPGKIVFDGKDPGFLWRNKAKEYISGKLRTYLDPNTPVERLPRS